ncbi:hypothetical protein NQ318_015210 [Aromia moschata]|uniref:CCHC-type domain-containing protein n=1 Tax=Aromia moschata TaxID=1265417 RepID=A0AAV8XKX7_9CUCU|nr:hypothetical protein NQ318_015210 [Aromia moschata]
MANRNITDRHCIFYKTFTIFLEFLDHLIVSPPLIRVALQLSSIVEEKQHLLWPHQGPVNPDAKPNGIRFPHFVGRKPFLVEQMHALNLDGENSLHHSNSSSNSSPNETPPGTPHGPGRGDAKPARLNGMPPFGPPASPPPPPPPAFGSGSVPYSYPQQFAALPPNRSMFHYNQAYRPAFTQYPNYPTDNFPTYSLPYIPLIYSSPYAARTPPGCYNCGAPGHAGSDCTGQNIEEITQKKAYQLEYAAPLPDAEKR